MKLLTFPFSTQSTPKLLYFSDDENDASDDSATEDPHIVSMDRSKTRAESERQKNRDRFLELEQGLYDFSFNIYRRNLCQSRK